MNNKYKEAPFGIYYARKDIDLKIIDCNPLFLQYVGFSNKDKILGCTDFDLSWENYAPLYRQHEIDVMNNNPYSVIFPSQDITGRKFVAFINKAPTFNDNNEVDGVACYNMEVINPKQLELYSLLEKTKLTASTSIYTQGNECNKINLTHREHTCLFYLLRGKSAKMIGKVLNLSPRTIEDYIFSLKIKFCCQTKSELIEKAINNGYMEILPQHFDIDNMVDLLKET